MLASQLRPATASGHQVPRPRLHTLLEESVEAAVTLVVAPAGSGKTTLLASWCSETTVPVAWVALDDADSDPVRLWSLLLAGLDQLAPGCAEVAATSVSRPGHLLTGIGLLLDDLEARSLATRALVVDDLHVVDGAEASAASIAFFVQHLPSWLHLVLISRREPALPVDRLRARGQLSEIRFPELRFTFEEASSMLGKLAPALDDDVVAEMASEAGGWAASIQFTALAARTARARGQDPVPHVGESLRYLDDYLTHEILAGESEELVDVLMTTSVVERVEPDLARVLADRADAPDLLALAQERGLFVSRTEPPGDFEVHGLVRERLVSILERRSRERLRQLYAAAAEWYQARGRTTLALDCWLRADRPRDALRLLAADAPALYDGGHAHRIAHALRAIPESVADDGPDAALEYAWCHMLVDRRRFVALVDGLQRRLQRTGAPDALTARLQVLLSIAATLRGDWDAGAAHARSALADPGFVWWLDPLGQFVWNMIGRDVAFSERWEEPSEVTTEILGAIAIAPDRRLALEGTRALGEALAGRPVDALRVAAGVTQRLQVATMVILRAEVTTAQAIAHREIGERSAALPLLQELVDEQLQPTVHCQLLAWLELVHARISEGNVDAAEHAFGSAVELVDTDIHGAGATAWLARTGTVLAIAQGELAEAAGWAARIKDPFWAAASSARVLLASGEPARANEALQGARPRCDRHRVVDGLLRHRAAQDPAEAERHLVAAVTLAARHGLVQTVADEGPMILDGVERLTWTPPVGWLRRLRRVMATDADLRTAASELVAPLTQRELEVLRMLPSRLTLRELADELYISPNTLKFHLKVIYRKLGCASRAEAAEIARALSSPRGPGQASSTRRR